MELLRKKLKQITYLRLTRAYPLKKSRILSEISFDYSKIVIVWGQSEQLSREETVKKLHSFGKLELIQERWRDKLDGTKAWNGAVVEYKKSEDAGNASVELPKQLRHARSTLLKTVIEILVDCELLYLESRRNKEPTKVTFCRRIPFRHQEVEEIHRNLSSYGNMQTFFINHRLTLTGALCEVTYPYLTQAYLAMILTDGLKTDRGVLSGSIESALENDEPDTKILKDAKECIVYFHQRFFPN